jgi:AcrR family transcriptional regulator
MPLEAAVPTKTEASSPPKREQLLTAGRAVFSERGFHAATVDQIAESAGVGKGTVYLYFRSKQELYVAIMEHDLEELHAETVQEMAKSETALDRIRAYMRVRCAFAESRHDFLRLLATESPILVGRNEALARLIGVTHPERSLLLLKHVLEDAINQGEIRNVSLDSAARLLYDLTVGMVRRRLTTDSDLNMENELDVALDVLWRGLGGAR